jgi:hypothetical protein
MGGALNYNMNTLNDQILQGIKFSGRARWIKKLLWNKKN